MILSNFCGLLRIYEPYKQTYEDTHSYAQPKNNISDITGSPIFSRSVNPITTWGGQIIPTFRHHWVWYLKNSKIPPDSKPKFLERIWCPQRIKRSCWFWNVDGILGKHHAKGQLISKCLFGVFDSSKKRTKPIRTEVSLVLCIIVLSPIYGFYGATLIYADSAHF